jgi:hypothetical protein
MLSWSGAVSRSEADVPQVSRLEKSFPNCELSIREARCHPHLEAKVEQAVLAIQKAPESWPPHKHSGFRKYFVERFPFTVFYLEMPDCIWVAAIAHVSRRPGYWTNRQLE